MNNSNDEMTVRHTYAETRLGRLLLVAEGDSLTGVYYAHHWYPPSASHLGPEVAERVDPVLAHTADELRAYLTGRRRTFGVAVTTHGDDFSERVWTLLRDIPYGRTTTYGALASRLGDKTLAQRVGQAVGHNPLSIIVPCHRVVGANGSLTGYAGGLARKRALLELEAAA
jgi:methylated-DNA-[protein]-cysteine S-methyltransferase